MHALQQRLAVRRPLLRIKAPNSEMFLRPVWKCVGPAVVCKAAGMGKPLRFRKVGFAAPQIVLYLLAFSDVVAGHQDCHRRTALISFERPAGCRDYLRSVLLALRQLAFPAAATKQFGLNLLKWHWKDSFQKFVGHLAHRLLSRPPIQLLCTT